MSSLNKMVVSVFALATFSAPAFAFLDGVVSGLTSVTNNLIDSTENVTNNTVNNATHTAVTLSQNPGKMADRIGQMADRIGFMADRIVTTEGIMAGLAHKIIDGPAKPQQRVEPARSFGFNYPYNNRINSGVALRPPVQNAPHNPYLNSPQNAAPAQVPLYGQAQGQGQGQGYGYGQQPQQAQYRQPNNDRYSASNMIYGVSGSTYTAARPAPQPVQNRVSGFGFLQQPTVTVVDNQCDYSYGVPVNCN